MASWGLLNALLGQKSDMYHKTLSFHPALDGELSSFFICGQAWGVVSWKMEEGQLVQKIEVLYGTLEDVQIEK